MVIECDSFLIATRQALGQEFQSEKIILCCEANLGIPRKCPPSQLGSFCTWVKVETFLKREKMLNARFTGLNQLSQCSLQVFLVMSGSGSAERRRLKPRDSKVIDP